MEVIVKVPNLIITKLFDEEFRSRGREMHSRPSQSWRLKSFLKYHQILLLAEHKKCSYLIKGDFFKNSTEPHILGFM